MTLPAVSVLMTLFNRRRYIGEAIESVLASHHQDFELVVVDDGSTDDSVEIARRYADTDQRVRVHVNETNLGDYPNRNRAASLARGGLIKYLDSDDRIYPWGLGAMVDIMQLNPQAALGLATVDHGERPHPMLLSPEEAYRTHFFERDIFGRSPGSAIIRRDAFNELGGFSGRRFVGDAELWFKIAARFPVVTMPRDLAWTRIHGEQEQVYERGASNINAIRNQLVLDALASPDCPLPPEQRDEAVAKLYRNHARQFWRLALFKGRPAAAWAYRADYRLPLARLLSV